MSAVTVNEARTSQSEAANRQTKASKHPAHVLHAMSVLLALWDELRKQQGPFLFEMHGSSLWPTAPKGSVLAVVPCASSALVQGDLVTFRRQHTIVTHRVIKVTSDGSVLAWGDAVLHPDAPVASVDVLGRATVVTRSSPLSDLWVAPYRAGAASVRLVDKIKRATQAHAT